MKNEHPDNPDSGYKKNTFKCHQYTLLILFSDIHTPAIQRIKPNKWETTNYIKSPSPDAHFLHFPIDQ